MQISLGTFLPSSQWKKWQILIFSCCPRVNSTSALFQQHFTQFHFVSTLDFVCHHQIHCITLLAFGTCARIFPFCFSGSSYWRTLPEWTCKVHSLYKVCSKETHLTNANSFSEQLHKSLENDISDSLPHLVYLNRIYRYNLVIGGREGRSQYSKREFSKEVAIN